MACRGAAGGGLITHDKGYYHSCLGRTRRKGAFGHTSYLSRSRGALSPTAQVAQAPGFDRAVAQRRSHASGLTRLSAEAIRSGPLRWACLGGCEKMGRL